MITFYDIALTLPEKAWSPNTLKTRISLNFKGLPYETEWIEYPDIESTVKKLGGAPTKKVDGRDLYTLPAILIAEYLDEKYPDKPLLYPPGTRAAIATLEDVFMRTIRKLVPIMIPEATKNFNPTSEAYYRRTREKVFGKTLEELAPTGPVRDAIREGSKG